MFSSLFFFFFNVVDTQLPDVQCTKITVSQKQSSEVLNETIVLNYVLIFTLKKIKKIRQIILLFVKTCTKEREKKKEKKGHITTAQGNKTPKKYIKIVILCKKLQRNSAAIQTQVGTNLHKSKDSRKKINSTHFFQNKTKMCRLAQNYGTPK